MGPHIALYGNMGYSKNMKTTIEISDHLLQKAKSIAQSQKRTLREITEEGLAMVIEKHSHPREEPIQPVVFGGNGLSPEFQGKSWAEIRAEIYRGYGS